MDRAAIGVEHTFMHHFAQRRVREDGVHQVFFRRFQLTPDDVALNQLGHFRADHMRAQKLSHVELGMT